MTQKLESLSAADLGRKINSREITALECVQYFEERITKYNGLINAFVYVDFEYAESKAKEIDEKLNRGEYVGPFAGVPFGLKEFLPNKIGWKSYHGGVRCLESVDEYNSVFCQAMEDAGGIAIGKCNAPSYGFRGTTDNKMFGPTSTPYNLKYNAGGSSGGSAAAVAAGLVPIAEGGDAGGSIRIPANYCNLFGFKAGIGTIPNLCRPDAWAATHPFCVNGGLTRTVEDAYILMSYMARYSSRDPFSVPTVLEVKPENVLNMKIAYTKNFDLFEVDSEVLDIFDKTINFLKSSGIDIEEVHFDFKHTANELAEQWCKGITVDCALELNHEKENGNDLLTDHFDDFPEEFISIKQECDKLGIEDLYKFNLARTDILDQFENVFENYDLILSPVCCSKGILNKNDHNTKGPDNINGKPVEPLIGWTMTYLVNFIGNPAASIPAGFTSDNVPMGIQIIGKRYDDKSILSFSKKYEELNPWIQYYNLF